MGVFLLIIFPVAAVLLGLFAYILKIMFEKGRMDTKIEHLWKTVIYCSLNLLLLLALLWSLRLYTSSFEKLPWYEPCGMQFLLIFLLSDPVFLAIGIALLILSRYYHISKLNKWLPFIAIAGLSLPLFGPLNRGELIGLPINIILCLLVVITTIANLINKKNRIPASK